jgi:uncharacterized membrane protein (DUF485 family)
MDDKITDLVYIKRCKKEAIFGTIKEFIKFILVCCCAVIGCMGFLFLMTWFDSWMNQSIIDMINSVSLIIVYGLCISGMLCCIYMIAMIVYEVYKDQLKKCVERIKSEQKVGEVNG